MASTAASAGPRATTSSRQDGADQVSDGGHGVPLGGRVQEGGGQARRTARGGGHRGVHQGVGALGTHTAQHEQHRAQRVVAARCQAGAGPHERVDAGVARGRPSRTARRGPRRRTGRSRLGQGAAGPAVCVVPAAAVVRAASARVARRWAGSVPGPGSTRLGRHRRTTRTSRGPRCSRGAADEHRVAGVRRPTAGRPSAPAAAPRWAAASASLVTTGSTSWWSPTAR